MNVVRYIICALCLLFVSLSITFPKDNVCETSLFNPSINKINLQDYSQRFQENQLVLIRDVFKSEFFAQLKEHIMNNLNSSVMKRNTTFESIRKAITVKASDMESFYIVRDIYYSKHFKLFLRNVTGMELENVSCNDEASMNLLVYNKPNDFISWHTDPNHYIGNRLTILISIINQNEKDDLSTSELQYMQNGELKSIKMPPNSMLIFNGSDIKHRATSIGDGDTRIVLSFTYCDICQETLFGSMLKSLKEIILGY